MVSVKERAVPKCAVVLHGNDMMSAGSWKALAQGPRASIVGEGGSQRGVPHVIDVAFREVPDGQGRRRLATVLSGAALLGAVIMAYDGLPERRALPKLETPYVDLHRETLALNSAISGQRVVVRISETAPDGAWRKGEMCETGASMLEPHGADIVVRHDFMATGRNCPNGIKVTRVR